MNIKHSSRTDLWYTPMPIINLIREVIGTIDLDPASDLFGNSRIQATKYLTSEDDGLVSEWDPYCSVYCNPPGGKIGNKSQVGLFWKKLMEYRDSGTLKHAIFMAFSIEAFQSTQRKGFQSMAEFLIPHLTPT